MFLRSPTNVCLPEPMFADVAACDAYGQFDGTPTVRDHVKGAFAAVFSGEGAPEEMLSEETVCAAMGMRFKNGVSHTSTQQHMRYVWYPLAMYEYCGANIGSANSHMQTILEKDEVHGMCLTRAESSRPKQARKFYDRIQCSCGESELSSALLQSGASVGSGIALWADFGPSGIVSPSCSLFEHTIGTVSDGSRLHQWMRPDAFGVADFDGESGAIVLEVPSLTEPLLISSDGEVAIMGWMRPDEYRSAAGVQLRDTTGSFGSALSIDGKGHYSLMVQDASGGYGVASSKDRAALGVWSHITGVISDHCLSIYVNATLQGKTCNIEGYHVESSDAPEIRIGSYETASHSSLFKGSMADIRIYQRSVNEKEIRDAMKDVGPHRPTTDATASRRPPTPRLH